MRAWLAMLMSGALAGPVVAQETMTIGRLQYDGGGDWYANPSSLPNLLAAVRERTGLPAAREEKVVALGDDELWAELKGSAGLAGDVAPAIEKAAKHAAAEARLEEPFAKARQNTARHSGRHPARPARGRLRIIDTDLHLDHLVR